MKKGISVIIPTYNREQFIEEAIQSVLNQECEVEVEIIISDDGSTDSTIARAQSFGDKVRILRKPKNCETQGASGSRNRGIIASKQPLICFLDSDDFYLPNHLKTMIQIFDSKPNLGFVFCRTLEVKEKNGKKLFKHWTHKRIFKNDISNLAVSRSRIVHTNSLMFQKFVFDKIGYFNEAYSNSEDIDLWMRISEQYKGIFSDHYGVVYRIDHGINQLTQNPIGEIDSCTLSVHETAVSRYKSLKLQDTNRIFELNHMIIHRKYSTDKISYLSKYLRLIIRFPISFLHRFPIFFFQVLDRKEMNKWSDLKTFINDN